MPNITVRDIPEAVYQKIKQEAETNRRSINSEILCGLERNYGKAQLNKQSQLENIRQLKAKIQDRIYLTDAFLEQAKRDSDDEVC